MTTTVHLSGPADVLTVLPYQLGFHPHDCLVVVSLHGARSVRMGLVQRIDLPPPEHVSVAVARMIVPFRAERPSAVLLIGFEGRDGESRTMLDEMAHTCRALGVEVADRMVVRGGRWFDLDCAQSCCPPEGLPLPAPSAVPAVAEFVGREICPLPDRSALADLLEPNKPLMSNAVSPLAEAWLQLRREAIGKGAAGFGTPDAAVSTQEGALREFRAKELAVWGVVLCEGDDADPILTLTPQDLAVLAVSLTDVDLRDGLIAWLCPDAMTQGLIEPSLLVQMGTALPSPPYSDGDVAETVHVIGRQRVERRLCELSASLPDAWAVSALTVLASFTWWRGDGALTRIALDRALRVDPHYRLALLLERMVDLVIRPERTSA